MKRPATISVVTLRDDVDSGKPARLLYEHMGFSPAELAPIGPEGGSRQVYRLELVAPASQASTAGDERCGGAHTLPELRAPLNQRFTAMPDIERGRSFAQDGFSARFEWGPTGAQAIAPVVDVLVIVDVLSFTTAVQVAVARGAHVYPYRYRDDSAATFAQSINATLAVDRQRVSAETPYSLSPASLTAIPAETSLVLPSPNGSAISALAAQLGRPMLAGCLRNAAAVAAAARARGETIGDHRLGRAMAG